MKHPKRCMDWKGLRVRPVREMATNGGDYYYPSDVLIVARAFGGLLWLDNADYGIDDLRTGISRVVFGKVEIIGPETAEQRQARRIRRWERDEQQRILDLADGFEGETRSHIDVTDDDEDAPDGARIGAYERIGDQWVRVADSEAAR
jgi:hypothetical protein